MNYRVRVQPIEDRNPPKRPYTKLVGLYDYKCVYTELPGFVTISHARCWHDALEAMREKSPSTGPEHMFIRIRGEWHPLFTPDELAEYRAALARCKGETP